MKLTAPPSEPPIAEAVSSPAPEPTDANAPRQPPPVPWPRWFAAADVLLVLLAVVLAFLLASFAARNSDIWVHLAAGRLLVDGGYSFGRDPFSYSAVDRVWVNHAWLFDAVTFWLYRVGDGAALVIAKALGVALAAAALLALRRPGFAWWPWTVCVTLALLAAAPKLLLGPFVVSIVFLALLMLILFRVPGPAGSWRLPVLVAVLFGIWANVDAWFFVGPLALALLVIGDLVQRSFSGEREREGGPEPLGPPAAVSTLAKALALGILACMLNPHHVRVWQLPLELVGVSGVDADPSLRQALALAPWQSDYLDYERFGRNINGVAYALLLVGGGVVLGFGVGRLRLGHLLLWLGFVLLSLRTATAIPLFAVVAVPLLAAQLNALSARLKAGRRFLAAASGVGRVVCLFTMAVLLFVAWPGWLHPRPDFAWDAARVAWGVDADPALRKAAEQLGQWRDAGKVAPEVHGFLVSAQLADYCAWFAPKEKVFLNSRFTHHAPELADFAAIRGNVGARAEPHSRPNLDIVEPILTRNRVGYVGVYDRGRQWVPGALNRLVADGTHWDLWYLDGRTGVFGWRPSAESGSPSFLGNRLDPVRLAFDPQQTPLTPGRDRLFEGWPPWYDEWIHPLLPAPPEADEALAWAEYRQFLNQQRQALLALRLTLLMNQPFRQAQFHGALVEAALVAGQVRPPVSRGFEGEFRALPLLTLRAAWRAIAANPDHPDGYLGLYRAFEDPELPMGELERLVGRIAALRQCQIRILPPSDYRAGSFTGSPSRLTAELAERYLHASQINIEAVDPIFAQIAGAMPFAFPGEPPRDAPPRIVVLNLARQEFLRAVEYADVERTHLQPGDNASELQTRRDAWAKQAKGLEAFLGQRIGAYKDIEERTPALKDRYQHARRMGLTDEALQLLQGSNLEKDFGDDWPLVAMQRVALELFIGRPVAGRQHLALLGEQLKKAELNRPQVDYVRSLLPRLAIFACQLEGDYQGAGRILDGNIARLVGPGSAAPPAMPLGALTYFTPLFAEASPFGALLHYPYGLLRLGVAQKRIVRSKQEAALYYSRGLLALYEGDIPKARESFEKADRPLPKGWNLASTRPEMASLYLRLIEHAERK